MQQNQLRLNLDLKTARGLKQPHQQHTERDFFQGPIKVRFTHGSDGSFQLIDTGCRRYPARFHMQLGNTFVIAPEKGREILR